MEFYQEILVRMLERGQLELHFKNLNIDATEIVKLGCYQILEKIRAVLCDESLDDPVCFLKIDAMVCIFEAFGGDCGNRHDFG